MRKSLPNVNPKAFKSCLFVLFAAFTMSVYGQTPPAPTGDLIQDFCSQATWQNAGFSAMPGDNLGDLQVHGENLTWYYDAALTQPVPLPIDDETLVDGTVYYVTQTVGGVESPALEVNVMELTCSCIKEPDFETQDGTPDADGYQFYYQDGDVYHKACGMDLTGVTPTPLATFLDNLAELVTPGDIPFLQADGITQSTTNPANPFSNVALRLNKEYGTDQSDIVSMSKEFVAGEVFVFNYALMYFDPDHPDDEQPFFQVRLYDKNDVLVQTRCIVSIEDDCVFLDATGDDIYTTWSCFKINTADLQGEKVRMEFTVGDCAASIHEGIVYIDDIYVGNNAGSSCNNFNFGYLAINDLTPAGTNTCYVVEPPMAQGACAAQATASLPFPIQVCGTYEVPTSSGTAPVLDNLTVNVLQNGNLVGTLTNPTFTGNTFCFTMDETDLTTSNPYGSFELSGDINFSLNCGFPYTIFIDDQTNFVACPPAGCPLPLVACDDTGTGVGTFDLTQRETVIANGWQNGVTYTYYENSNDAFDQINEIASPAAYSNSVSGGQTIYVRTDWDLPGTTEDCFYLVEMEVQVLAVPVVNLDQNIVVCGNAAINIPLSATPSNLADLQTITYEWFMGGVRLPVLGSTYTITAPGTYEVIVSNNLQCSVTQTIVVERVDYDVDLGGDQTVCSDNPLTLTANLQDNGSTNPIDPANATYSWSTGATTQSIDVTQSGTYTVDVTYKGCTETDTIVVNKFTQPIVELPSDFEICLNENEPITVNASIEHPDPSTLEYVWYRDGGVISGETGSSIPITAAGTYRVEVAEQGAVNCFGEDAINITVYANENCIVPQGISPNGDQYNQSLDLTFLNDRTGISSVEIFNRHGRSVYVKTGGYTNEWEGQTDNGDELVTGTYYYVIKLDATDTILGKQVLTGWIYINREIQ